MGSTTTADKAVSTEEDPDDGGGEMGSGDGERLCKPDDESEVPQKGLHHNTCFEVAQLQAVLNQLLENKVEAIKQEAATVQLTRRRRFLLMRMILSSGAMVRRLKRRGSSSAETKPSPEDHGTSNADQRQSTDRKHRKRTTEERSAAGGAGSGPNKSKRVNRQRIGSSSRPESPIYNPGIYHDGTTQHSDDDIVFLPSPCCCDTDGHTTMPVDPAFDSDYISVKIDDDDNDDDMIYAPAPQPLPYQLPYPESHQLHHHHHHLHDHQEEFNPNGWRHSYDMGTNIGGVPTLSGANIMGAHTDCSEEDEIKKAERLARRHRRRRRRKRRRREKLAQGHRQLPSHLGTVAVCVDEVRVIDPDELPRKARVTIAATACLLLFMCLLLVGVTLRMAPLIDEMVREQNRDFLKSLQREPTTTLLPPPSSISGGSSQGRQQQQHQGPQYQPLQQEQQHQHAAAAAAVTA